MVWFSFTLLIFCLSQASDAILNGALLSIHRAPFIVSVVGRHYYFERLWYQSTGIIVHRRFVLISLKRCSDLRNITIGVGQSYLRPANERCEVTNQWLYPRKPDSAYSRYFCLLRLKKLLRLGPTIQVARIAGPGDKIPQGDVLAAAGFGILYPKYEDEAYAKQLHVLKTSVYKGNCDKFYDKKWLQDDVWCIGDTRQYKTAKGDEGGPVFSVISGRVYAHIVNYQEKEKFEKMKEPSIVNDLSASRDWIYEIIDKQLDKPDPNPSYCE